MQIQQIKNFYKAYSIYLLKNVPIEDDDSKKMAKTLNDVLIFVLDKSGSMSGSRIINLKAAVIDLTEKVRDGFKSVHYISFDTFATEITFEQINSLQASGGTSFDNANEKMFECIDRYPEGISFTVIYFTDGEGSVNFLQLKTKLNSLSQKDVIFHTIGFSSESNKSLLVELTQSGSTFGTFKSIETSADIKFDDFAFLFNESKRGQIELQNNTAQYYVLDSSNEACLFFNQENTSFQVKNCLLNNTEHPFEVTLKEYNEIEHVEERLKILEAFFNFVLLKKIDANANNDDLFKEFTDYKLFIEHQVTSKIDQNSTILEIETLNETFNDLLQTLNSYIQETRKSNSNFTELKSLTYDKISKLKFSKRLDQRIAKNELKFIKNFNKMKEIVSFEGENIEKLNENDFPDYCYLTQSTYKDLLKNQDCLGVCFRMKRGGEVVIVDPNFIQINEIGYSSFVSLNSMFMALKYCLDRNQGEQEVLNLHGGFMKNFQSHFLDGTHRAEYNAMIPLYINEFHWRIARLLLEPLFGYLVTLNINGYSSDQYYTLYFLVLEKIILDMIYDSKGLEAKKRIFEQIKMCCENVLREFHILKPNVQNFLDDRLKRTRDEWPNLSSYILYIYFNKDEQEIVDGNFEQFEYCYFEEQMRRYLGMEFKKGEAVEVFEFDRVLIATAVSAVFCMEDDEKNMKICSMNNDEMIDFMREKAGIELINEQKMVKKDIEVRFMKYFDGFCQHKITKLFDFVFNCKTEFFIKYKTQAVPLVYQMLTYGRENEKWRFYKNYSIKFEDGNFMRNEYMNLVCEEIRSEFGKLISDLGAKRAKFISLKYLNSENFSNTTFCTGELVFSTTCKLLQEKVCDGLNDVDRIFHFINNSFNNKLDSSTGWTMSRQNTFRFFKVIYRFEKRNCEARRLNESTIAAVGQYLIELYNETVDKEKITELVNESINKKIENNDKLIIYKYPLSWELLRLKYDVLNSKYRFDVYRCLIDHEDGVGDRKLMGYIDSVKYTEDKNLNKLLLRRVDAIPVPVAVVEVKRVVKFYEDFNRPINTKSIVDLEKEWISEQLRLRCQNVLHDTEDWQHDFTKLKHIAVLDLICDKNDNSTCAAGIMVFEMDHVGNKMTLVEAALLRTKLTEPYLSGLLAFREAWTYQELLKKINVKPQLLLFDGNGVLHKREFGIACQVGVVENFVTIGLAKKLHFVDGFPYKTLPEFKQYFQPLLKNFQDFCELKTVDDKVLGYAYLSGVDTSDPVFISPGHKISLTTAMSVMMLIDGYLKNMGKSARESLVGYVDKMTRRHLNKFNGFDNQLDNYF